MINKKCRKVLFIFVIFLIFLYVTSIKNDVCSTETCSDDQKNYKLIHLCVVACGDRLEETLTMIKSATLFTKELFFVHIFADDILHPMFNSEILSWPEKIKDKFEFRLYPIQFPSNENTIEWRKLFKECASQRLFIPNILNTLKTVLYVDTDILFLRPLEDIWSFLEMFNSTQIAAMSPEHEEPSAAWYNRFARHPYVPPLGINSGVMLMNMDRMRKSNWLEHIVQYLIKHKLDITWGDQDLINIYFHYFPDQLFQYECSWNYRPDHCMYSSTCHHAVEHGVSILHGNRGVFHSDKQPVFKAVYDAIKQYKFEDNIKQLLQLLDLLLAPHLKTNCGQVENIITKQLRTQINLIDSK